MTNDKKKRQCDLCKWYWNMKEIRRDTLEYVDHYSCSHPDAPSSGRLGWCNTTEFKPLTKKKSPPV